MATIGFCDETKFGVKLQGVLSHHGADISVKELVLVTDSLTDAYAEIKSALMARGCTAVQVDLWIRGLEFQRDIAIYLCIIGLGKQKGANEDRWHYVYNRRKELAKVAIVLSDGTVISTGSEGDADESFAEGVNLVDVNEELDL